MTMTATATESTYIQTTLHELRCKGSRLLWDDAGRVIIISEYGNWSYWWGHRGQLSVPAFLAKLDSGYMAGKLLGQHSYEHDDDKSVKAIREHIISYRRDGDIDAKTARDEWELVKEYESGDLDFRGWVERSTITDAYEFSQRELSRTWQCFWRKVWVPMFQPELKQLAAGQKD